MTRNISMVTFGSALAAALVLGTPSAHAAKCDGIAPDMISKSLAASRDIVDAQEIKVRRGKQALWQTAGAEIRLLAEAGDTEAWLNRVAVCKIANLSSKSSKAGTAFQGAKVSVYRAGPTFVIRVTNDNQARAKKIVKLALDLKKKYDKKP